MRAWWVLVLLATLLLAAPATPVPTLEEIGGGVDPRVPEDLHDGEQPAPWVEAENATWEVGSRHQLGINVSMKGAGAGTSTTFEVTLEIYQYAMFEKEEALDEITDPPPVFIVDVPGTNNTTESLVHRVNVTFDGEGPVTVPNLVSVPEEAREGMYRVRLKLEWANETNVTKTAYSWGHHTPASWAESIRSIADGGDPTMGDHVVSEGGVTVVPRDFNEVRLPNQVPDLGNFTTPVIRPGESGKYGFRLTNRYDRPMTDVRVTIEFYMWATIEDAKDIEDIEGPPPKVRGEGATSVTRYPGDIPPGGSVPVDIVITTSEDTDKGTYFVRHRVEFTYGDEPDSTSFRMDSRGFFTFEQWEGFDYSNLYYQLGVAGIVPDSSFSVKDPVPLWPLATLIALCVLFGVLAVVFYLAEEHGDQYPRLKRRLQALTGRWEQRKRLLQQRMDELRGEEWDDGDDGRRDDDDDGGDDGRRGDDDDDGDGGRRGDDDDGGDGGRRDDDDDGGDGGRGDDGALT